MGNASGKNAKGISASYSTPRHENPNFKIDSEEIKSISSYEEGLKLIYYDSLPSPMEDDTSDVMNIEEFEVKYVYDGDILTIDDADSTRVRLIGIDTPKMKDSDTIPKKKKDGTGNPYSLPAKEYTESRCEHKKIWVVFNKDVDIDDANDDDDDHDKKKQKKTKKFKRNKKNIKKNCHIDPFGRIIGWVYCKATNDNDAEDEKYECVNEGIVLNGHGIVYIPIDTLNIMGKKENIIKLLTLQKYARDNKLGIWKDYEDYDAIKSSHFDNIGTCFHKKTCSIIKNVTQNLVNLKASEAYDQGLNPCLKCIHDKVEDDESEKEDKEKDDNSSSASS